MSTPLSEFEVHRKARQIVKGLDGVTVNDALSILNKALGVVINENLKIEHGETTQTVSPFNPNLVRRRTRSKIENDPDVKAFIHGLPVYLSITKIAALCVEKFGKQRAPSKSAVGRYIQRLKKPNHKPVKGGCNE